MSAPELPRAGDADPPGTTDHDAHPVDPIAADHETGNTMLKSALAVGALGLAGTALGATCPLCVVATPALLGGGAFHKARAWWRTKQRSRQE